MVSLNPEYGLEVELLVGLANRVRDDNPALYAVLTTVASSVLIKDEKHLSEYCSAYLLDTMYNKSLQSELEDILGNISDDKSTKNPPSLGLDDEL